VKTCHIYPITTGTGAYQWKWKCVEGKSKTGSTRAFELFYECVEDARRHGAEIDLEHVHRQIADAAAVPRLTAQSSRR
jgi:hypothetical protein